MDIVRELKKLNKKNSIRNLGIGLDINKLILLLNNVKVEMQTKSQLIRGLESKAFYYKNKACDLMCSRTRASGKCPETCNNYDEFSDEIWCREVLSKVNRALDSESKQAPDSAELDEGKGVIDRS